MNKVNFDGVKINSMQNIFTNLAGGLVVHDLMATQIFELRILAFGAFPMLGFVGPAVGFVFALTF